MITDEVVDKAIEAFKEGCGAGHRVRIAMALAEAYPLMCKDLIEENKQLKLKLSNKEKGECFKNGNVVNNVG